MGRRFVAVLENTVLVLILALIGLIAAETMLERASATGLSAGQHRLFAWADLAICSVFLFEFALKLILAPHRMTYFLRHLAIDFVASLPFGFLAHSIDLAQMADRRWAGSTTQRVRATRPGRPAGTCGPLVPSGSAVHQADASGAHPL